MGVGNGHALPIEDILMATDASTARLFDKLDAIQATGATTAADVARIQGTQKGIELAVETLKNSIGDVIETKLEVRETKTKMASVEQDLSEIRASMVRAETKDWVEPLVRWAVSALIGGSAIGAGAAAASKMLGV